MTMIEELRYWHLDDEIPTDMPVLRSWLDGATKDKPLAGVTGLLIQHQLGNHFLQAEGLIALGLAPEDLYWVDIPYSSTLAVREALLGLGIPTGNFIISDFQLLDDYADYQRNRVLKLLQQLLEDSPELLLILDDGSYALEAMLGMRDRPKTVAIVEQTARGIIKIEESFELKKCSQEYRIINVACSSPKKTLEPPFIGAAVCDALRRKLGVIQQVGQSDHCLVLGYGAIGTQVAKFLVGVQGFKPSQVHVYDTKPDRMTKASKDGYVRWDKGDSKLRFKLVVGCSGRASFMLGDQEYLEDGALLASATSGTVELSRQEFIELADFSPDDDISVIQNDLDEAKVHSDIQFNFYGRTATFLNGGFPVNFDGRVNCVPAHYIQPTQTMMCAAAVQAVQTTETGLIDLDKGFCGWLTNKFKEVLGDEARFLPEDV